MKHRENGSTDGHFGNRVGGGSSGEYLHAHNRKPIFSEPRFLAIRMSGASREPDFTAGQDYTAIVSTQLFTNASFDL